MQSKLTAVLVAAGLVMLGACAGAPTPSPTAAPPQATTTPSPTQVASPSPVVSATPSPTIASTPSPTIAVTPSPTATVVPTATITATPTATLAAPSPTPSGEAEFPNQSESALISYVAADARDSCVRYPPTYPTELASISCGTEDLPFEYTLFGSIADMAAAYNHDLTLGESPPQPDGKCADANFEDTYDGPDGAPAGRLNCRGHTSSTSGSHYRVMEWTNEQLLVLGYISNRTDLHTWAELIDFWQTAGPTAS